jgi:hypothetical protein
MTIALPNLISGGHEDVRQPEYAAKESIATSLFPSDQAVMGDDAIARILSSKLELPAKAKVALMEFRRTR